MKTYNVASPYFSNAEKKRILEGTQKVLDGRLSTGPYTKKFEKKFARFIGCKFAVFLNSCTSALEIAVKSLNLNSSDEVIVPCETLLPLVWLSLSRCKSSFCKYKFKYILY